MSKRSKAYQAAAEKVDHDQLYSPIDAVKLAKETSSKNQDATIEVAIRLGVRSEKQGISSRRREGGPRPALLTDRRGEAGQGNVVEEPGRDHRGRDPARRQIGEARHIKPPPRRWTTTSSTHRSTR